MNIDDTACINGEHYEICDKIGDEFVLRSLTSSSAPLLLTKGYGQPASSFYDTNGFYRRKAA